MQTLTGATQFDGNTGSGLFSFARYNHLALDHRIVIKSIGYFELPIPSPVTTNIRFYVAPSDVGISTEGIVVGVGTAATIVDAPSGVGGLTRHDIAIPRALGTALAPGPFWFVRCFSDSKVNDATVSIDYVVTSIYRDA